MTQSFADVTEGEPMLETLSKALVLTILRHAEDFPWRMQDIGLMSLRLDDCRQHRLHVWDPTDGYDDPPIHDHPYDFSSRIVVGQLTNIRYREDVRGAEYERFRFPPGAEDRRRAETVTPSAEATTLTEGAHYGQRAGELHASSQLPGTVTVIRCSWVAERELTVCLRDGSAWRSGRARDATRDEVKVRAANALEWF